MKMLIKQVKGMSLVALVITIIVLLILAGIVLILLDEGGIIQRAKLSKNESIKSQRLENEALSSYEDLIDSQSNNQSAEISPNYKSKVDLLQYKSQDNQYTAPTSGYIIIPSVASQNQAHCWVYIDDNLVSFVGRGTTPGYIRISVCVPIAKGSRVYYVKETEDIHRLQIDEFYFVPNG